MFFFNRHRNKSSSVLTKSKVHFLCKQDGPSERNLNEKLISFFLKRRNILRAYLVNVKYEDGGAYAVALCLRTSTDQDDLIVVEAVNSVFASIFNFDCHLDIIFLSDDQELQLKEVCEPFFVKEPIQKSNVS